MNELLLALALISTGLIAGFMIGSRHTAKTYDMTVKKLKIDAKKFYDMYMDLRRQS